MHLDVARGDPGAAAEQLYGTQDHGEAARLVPAVVPTMRRRHGPRLAQQTGAADGLLAIIQIDDEPTLQ